MSEVVIDEKTTKFLRGLGYSDDVISEVTPVDIAALRKVVELKNMMEAAKAAGFLDATAKKKICDNCAFFSGPNYECRRYPPKILEAADETAFFPSVAEDNWCGEWVEYEE